MTGGGAGMAEASVPLTPALDVPRRVCSQDSRNSEGIRRAGTDRLAWGHRRDRGRAGRPGWRLSEPAVGRARIARQGARSARLAVPNGDQTGRVSRHDVARSRCGGPPDRNSLAGGEHPDRTPPCAFGCARRRRLVWRPGTSRRWWRPCMRRACRSRWSTRARCVTLPAPTASWPRRTRWMPRCSRALPPPAARAPAPRGGHAAPARAGHPASAAPGHAGGRATPAPPGPPVKATSSIAYPGAPPGAARRQIARPCRRHPSADPRQLAPEHPRRRSRRHHPAGRGAGGTLDRKRSARRRRPLAATAAPGAGAAPCGVAGPRGPLHGRPHRQPPPSGPRLLSPAAGGGQAAQGGPHRLPAQAARALQRPVQAGTRGPCPCGSGTQLLSLRAGFRRMPEAGLGCVGWEDEPGTARR